MYNKRYSQIIIVQPINKHKYDINRKTKRNSTPLNEFYLNLKKQKVTFTT